MDLRSKNGLELYGFLAERVKDVDEEVEEEGVWILARAVALRGAVEAADQVYDFDCLPWAVVLHGRLYILELPWGAEPEFGHNAALGAVGGVVGAENVGEEVENKRSNHCLLYTSDAADE